MSENESVIEQNEQLEDKKGKRGYKFTEARKLALEKARKIRKENNDVAKRILEKASKSRKRNSPKYKDYDDASDEPEIIHHNNRRKNEENDHSSKKKKKSKKIIIVSSSEDESSSSEESVQYIKEVKRKKKPAINHTEHICIDCSKRRQMTKICSDCKHEFEDNSNGSESHTHQNIVEKPKRQIFKQDLDHVDNEQIDEGQVSLFNVHKRKF